MKFLHMADVHLDGQFTSLADKGNLAIQRRLEQRNAMKDIVKYIKQTDIEYLFIAGDLYEQEYIRKSTIEYINNLFTEIPEVKIFITPGNHDPYIKNSFYRTYKWAENVHIFTSELEVIEEDDVDVYGYGFNDFYMENKFSKIEIKNPDKINVLVTHGSLDASDTLQKQYNPIKNNDLKKMGFDYVALGHIHKASYNDYKDQRIVYPGSCISLGFDELGKRGVVVGKVEKDNYEIAFIPINTKTFEEEKLDISNLNSQEDLLQKLNELELSQNSYYEIILEGISNFTINKNEILDLVQNEQIIKIKDNTKSSYDIEKISKEQTLAGLFARKMSEKLKENPEDEKLKKAFDIGMEVLKG